MPSSKLRLATTTRSTFLETLDPKARDDLRSVLIRDHADRDAISSRLMHYRDQTGARLGGHHRLPDDAPHARRQVVRLLAEIDASKGT